MPAFSAAAAAAVVAAKGAHGDLDVHRLERDGDAEVAINENQRRKYIPNFAGGLFSG
jgi:hypothetical protein